MSDSENSDRSPNKMSDSDSDREIKEKGENKRKREGSTDKGKDKKKREKSSKKKKEKKDKKERKKEKKDKKKKESSSDSSDSDSPKRQKRSPSRSPSRSVSRSPSSSPPSRRSPTPKSKGRVSRSSSSSRSPSRSPSRSRSPAVKTETRKDIAPISSRDSRGDSRILTPRRRSMSPRYSPRRSRSPQSNHASARSRSRSPHKMLSPLDKDLEEARRREEDEWRQRVESHLEETNKGSSVFDRLGERRGPPPPAPGIPDYYQYPEANQYGPPGGEWGPPEGGRYPPWEGGRGRGGFYRGRGRGGYHYDQPGPWGGRGGGFPPRGGGGYRPDFRGERFYQGGGGGGGGGEFAGAPFRAGRSGPPPQFHDFEPDFPLRGAPLGRGRPPFRGGPPHPHFSRGERDFPPHPRGDAASPPPPRQAPPPPPPAPPKLQAFYSRFSTDRIKPQEALKVFEKFFTIEKAVATESSAATYLLAVVSEVHETQENIKQKHKTESGQEFQIFPFHRFLSDFTDSHFCCLKEHTQKEGMSLPFHVVTILENYMLSNFPEVSRFVLDEDGNLIGTVGPVEARINGHTKRDEGAIKDTKAKCWRAACIKRDCKYCPQKRPCMCRVLFAFEDKLHCRLPWEKLLELDDRILSNGNKNSGCALDFALGR